MERQNASAAISLDTLLSLQQLDPSPIELDSPLYLDLNKDLPSLPHTSPPGTHVLGLSGSGRSTIYYLTKLQRYSTYSLAPFLTFHLTTTSLLPLLLRSVPACEPYLLLVRPFYQSLPFEALLVTLPLLTHILSGLSIRLLRRSHNLKRYGYAHVTPSERLRRGLKVWPVVSWQALGGYTLTVAMAAHVYVNRILPLVVDGDSSSIGLGYVAHGFAKHPALAWGAYAVLLGAAGWHVVWGAAMYAGVTGRGERRERRRRRWVINGLAAAFTAVWAAGGLGVVARGGKATGWVAKGWDGLYSRIPLMEL